MKRSYLRAWIKFRNNFTHKGLREIAMTLNCFNIIEIVVIAWVMWEAHNMLAWYRSIMTVEHFNGVAYWGAMGGLFAGVIGAFKYMNDTLKEQRR